MYLSKQLFHAAAIIMLMLSLSTTIQVQSFTITSTHNRCAQHQHQHQLYKQIQRTQLNADNTIINVDHDDDEDSDEDDSEPGTSTMRVGEIKSELSLRGVDYTDCFDKESLAQKLVLARASGKSDPTIIDQFNKQRVRIIRSTCSYVELS